MKGFAGNAGNDFRCDTAPRKRFAKSKQSRYAALLKADLFREGIDGEALDWACQRLKAREAQRRLLFVVSDGCPMDSATALANALAEEFDFRRLVGVVGVLGDKDAEGLLEALEPVLDHVVITNNGSPRALETETLAEIARAVFGEDRVTVEPFLPDAVETAIGLAEESDGQPVAGSGVVITGSVVTAGAARSLFGKEPS